MARVSRLLTVSALLVAAAAPAAAAQPGPTPGSRASVEPLKPEWSRPVGGRVRLVGVEESGRCSVFVDHGAVQVVTRPGDVSWTWPFAKISKYINPREVAVSHECDAIALVGDSSYKYVWIVERGGKSVSLPFSATPAEAAFDRTGQLVAVGTYAGTLQLHSRSGELQWKRDTGAAIVHDVDFTDDNSRIVFKGWGGAGVVDANGQVQWGTHANRLAAARDLSTFIFSHAPNHGPGLPSIALADAGRSVLWHRWGSTDAFISAKGDRVLAMIDTVQEKKESDFFDGGSGGAEIQLLSRDATVMAAFPDYRRAIALSEDGDRMWLAAEEYVACVNDRGDVLARIDVEPSYRGVLVSRDFSQVLIVSEKDLHPVSVERYEVPPPCRK